MRGEHRHRGRARPARDPVDELVPPRREALRRVRHELQGVADVRLQALAHRHDLQHEPRAPVVGRQDGVRDARRRRRPHRRHDLPDVPRPPPPRGHERHRADAARLDRLPPRRLRPARVLLRRHLRLAQDRLPGPARAARPARPARGLRRRLPRRGGPVRLPAALAARQRHALAPERPVRPGVVDRRGRQADRAPDARRGRPRGVPRGSRDDRLLGPLAVAGRARDRRLQGVRRLRARAADADARAPRRRAAGDRGLPVVALGAGLRARPRAPRRADPAHRADRARARGRRPRDAPDRPPRRRGGDARRARRAALHARRRARGPARRALERRGRPRPARPDGEGRRDRSRRPTRTRSGACGRRCAAGRPPRCCCRPSPATSSSTGAATTTSAAAPTARCTRTTRWARCCGAGTGPDSRDARPQWSLRDIVPMVREHFGVA